MVSSNLAIFLLKLARAGEGSRCWAFEDSRSECSVLTLQPDPRGSISDKEARACDRRPVGSQEARSANMGTQD